jgi:hypothetical protein
VIALRADLKVVVAAHPVDFRKSVHTLSALVSEALRANPYCGDVFVFRSKRARFERKMKIVPENGSCRSCSRTIAARPSAPLRKSTGAWSPPGP